jgi:hypothetical protein
MERLAAVLLAAPPPKKDGPILKERAGDRWRSDLLRLGRYERPYQGRIGGALGTPAISAIRQAEPAEKQSDGSGASYLCQPCALR